MRKLLSIRSTATLFALFALAGVSFAQPYTGRVTIGQANADPGQTVGVPVYIGGNNVSLAGFRLPLKYSSSDLTPDSISLVGSLVDPQMTAVENLQPDSNYFSLTILPPLNPGAPKIDADSGLLATFWFTVSPGAGSQAIVVDSLNTVDTVLLGNPPILLLRRIELVDTNSISLTPQQFTPGQVLVLSTDVVTDDPVALPNQFSLDQNYPNPFNPSTKISFSLPKTSKVHLQVFNLLGQKVETIYEGTLGAGRHVYEFNAGNDMPSGVYFLRLNADAEALTRKMMLVK